MSRICIWRGGDAEEVFEVRRRHVSHKVSLIVKTKHRATIFPSGLSNQAVALIGGAVLWTVAGEQHRLRVAIDDYLYLADFEGLQVFQGVLQTRLDELEADLDWYTNQPVTGVLVVDYLAAVHAHWVTCQVLGYLFFRRQQTERQLLRVTVDTVVAPGSVPSGHRAAYLSRLVDTGDVVAATSAVAVMRHMLGEFQRLQVRVQRGMQTAALADLYAAAGSMERAADALGTLENDIIYLERNLGVTQ